MYIKNSKAAKCSDELTCCNAHQGTATTDIVMMQSMQQRISQAARNDKYSYFRFYMCHSVEVLKTMYKLPIFLHYYLLFFVKIFGSKCNYRAYGMLIAKGKVYCEVWQDLFKKLC